MGAVRRSAGSGNAARKKKITGCWECSEPETCKKLLFLVPVHGDAHLRNISTIRKQGMNGFISGKRSW